MTATVTRQVSDMSAEPFDPLVDLDGLWTVDLAERYLPIPGVPAAKYECWDGRLYMAPYEAAINSYGPHKLGWLIRPAVKAAGLYYYGSVNLLMGQPNRWLQPDVAVLKSFETGLYVLPEHCELVGEFVSPSSRKRDRIDKPRRYADYGIPWYMPIEVIAAQEYASVMLYQLVDGEYVLRSSAVGGTTFEMAAPFEAAFDPADLLTP